jgi:hypothetical protein
MVWSSAEGTSIKPSKCVETIMISRSIPVFVLFAFPPKLLGEGIPIQTVELGMGVYTEDFKSCFQNGARIYVSNNTKTRDGRTLSFNLEKFGYQQATHQGASE